MSLTSSPTPLSGGNLAAYNGVAGVTAAYFLVYKSFLGLQVAARSKHSAAGDFSRFSYEGKPWWQMADRTVANTLEQSIPFLGGMWTHAIFVDPAITAALGGVYVATRFLYPVLWAAGGKFDPKFMTLSTIPGYCVSGGFTASLCLKLFFGVDIVASLSGYGLPVKALAIMVLGFATTMLAFFGVGGTLGKITAGQFPDETTPKKRS